MNGFPHDGSSKEGSRSSSDTGDLAPEAPVRPHLLVACVGTATEVGKTWVGAQVVAALRHRAVRVAARKPAESFDDPPGDPLDSQLLADASGEPAEAVTPPHRRYRVPLAPPMAAKRLGLAPPLLASMISELRWPQGCRVGWLETVGGVRSPIARDGDSLDLCTRIRPDLVVLVGDASLGAVGAVRSALDSLALGHWGNGSLAEHTVVLLNRYDAANPGHRENLEWLTGHLPQPVLTDIPALADLLESRSAAG